MTNGSKSEKKKSFYCILTSFILKVSVFRDEVEDTPLQ